MPPLPGGRSSLIWVSSAKSGSLMKRQHHRHDQKNEFSIHTGEVYIDY